MPIYEYRCEKCGELNEFLVLGKDDDLRCKKCSSKDLIKLMSAPNISSIERAPVTEQGSGGCCGTPNSCNSPGSCCAG